MIRLLGTDSMTDGCKIGCVWSDGTTCDRWCPTVPELCVAETRHSLCSQSAWLSPAAPPSASSPSPLSSGPLTRRHCRTQSRGVCDDTKTTGLTINKVHKRVWEQKHWEQKETKGSPWTAAKWVPWPRSEETGQTGVFPWKQSQSLTFLGCRRSCRWRRWSPCCLSSPGSGCHRPGCRSVATGGAGWSDELWETDLWGGGQRWLSKITAPSVGRVTPSLAVD